MKLLPKIPAGGFEGQDGNGTLGGFIKRNAILTLAVIAGHPTHRDLAVRVE